MYIDNIVVYWLCSIQIDSTAPVMNASVITETLSSGIVTISLSNLDVGSGVQEVDILQKQGLLAEIFINKFKSKTINKTLICFSCLSRV